MLQAHERGELDLDVGIDTYLPPATISELHVLRGVDHSPRIMVRHLASHTSGLPGLYDRQRRLELPQLIRSSNDLCSTTEDLLTFQRALLAGGLFRDPRTVELLTERRNRLRNLAGTVDQARGRAVPFRLMATVLRAW